MMARLWADQIIAGKKKFHETPAKLKPQVRQILIDEGHEDLIDE
jgi:hypothetical protein